MNEPEEVHFMVSTGNEINKGHVKGEQGHEISKDCLHRPARN